MFYRVWGLLKERFRRGDGRGITICLVVRSYRILAGGREKSIKEGTRPAFASRLYVFLPSGLYLKVKLTRFQFTSLPFLLLTISCCHFHLLSPLITSKLLPGIATSSLRPVLSAFPAFPLLTDPSNGLVSS